jgi:hypothetical protein
MKECPNHNGSFDCTPFCRICEGEQEYEYTGTLPCRNFGHCGTDVDEDIWHEELGFCVPCQHKYFNEELPLDV